MPSMTVTAWNNGSHHATGAGYGLKVGASDRDTYFKRSWETILLQLPGSGDPVEVNVAKSSFWRQSCREIINRRIGQWLLARGYAPWPAGAPPRFRLEPVGERIFRLREK